MQTPFTDSMFTSVFIMKNSFTASTTCVAMIFLSINAKSFSWNSNAINRHYYHIDVVVCAIQQHNISAVLLLRTWLSSPRTWLPRTRPKCLWPRPECEELEPKDLFLKTHQNMFRWNIDTSALFVNHNYLNLHLLKTVTYRKMQKNKKKSVLTSRNWLSRLRTWLSRPRPNSSWSRPQCLSSRILEAKDLSLVDTSLHLSTRRFNLSVLML